jgi:protein dithiol:quinone oxidoreductase
MMNLNRNKAMRLPAVRITYLLGVLAVSVLMAMIYYLQVYVGLKPCPLCVLQRFMLAAFGCICLLGCLAHFKKWLQITLALLAFLFATSGLLIAGRQVWLQYFPNNHTGDCAGSLEFMLQVLPFSEVVHKVFSGTADCTKIDWTFLNLSLATWSCVCFAGFMVMAGLQTYRAVTNANTLIGQGNNDITAAFQKSRYK